MRTAILVVVAALISVACTAPAPGAQSGQAVPTATQTTASTSAQPPVLPTLTPAPASDDIQAEVAPFAPDQVRLALAPVAQGLDRPLFITHAGDGSGRLFIVEKPGRVRILQNSEVLAAPFLDISDRVGSSGSEQGLLGLAFAPNYEQSGHFFVNYTDTAGDTVIARFQVSPQDPNLADPATESPVLRLDQPAPNHNGGMLAFGPDGYLYIGTGDGGAANDRFKNGQNPDTLLGKMLRLDVTSDPSQPYTIPAGNPWVNTDWNGANVRDEIWAVGLRNPWRYSFDRDTDDLWIADVGQNAYEEVNLTPAGSPGGLNFGWPTMEGTHCSPESVTCDSTGLVMPVADYDHAGHCSVTGGYVYRGAAYPQLSGVYFYGDYCSGTIWALWQGGDGAWQNAEILASGLTLSSFGEDEAGEIYVADLAAGTVHRLTLE